MTHKWKLIIDVPLKPHVPLEVSLDVILLVMLSLVALLAAILIYFYEDMPQ